MSDIIVTGVRPGKGKGHKKKLAKVIVTGRLNDAEWEEFKESLSSSVKRFGRKLKVSFSGGGGGGSRKRRGRVRRSKRK